jgi:hypothetical protein
MGDLEFSLPDPMHSHMLNEMKDGTDKTKPEECALPEICNQTADADLLPAFQTQFGGGGIHAFPDLGWSLSVDQSLFDWSAGTVDTTSVWNQNNWGDAMADPALYLP